jgi:hypothetical protein
LVEHANAGPSGWERPDAPLGTLIYRAGLVAKERLEEALAEGQRTGRRLGEVLLQKGWIDEKDLTRLLAGQRGLAFVSLRGRGFDAGVARLLPERVARTYNAMPIEIEDDELLVAVGDPTDDDAIAELRSALARDFELVVAVPTEIRGALDTVYAARAALDAAAPAAPAPAPAFESGLRLAAPAPVPLPEPAAPAPRLAAESDVAPPAPAEPSSVPSSDLRLASPPSGGGADLEAGPQPAWSAPPPVPDAETPVPPARPEQSFEGSSELRLAMPPQADAVPDAEPQPAPPAADAAPSPDPEPSAAGSSVERGREAPASEAEDLPERPAEPEPAPPRFEREAAPVAAWSVEQVSETASPRPDLGPVPRPVPAVVGAEPVQAASASPPGPDRDPAAAGEPATEPRPAEEPERAEFPPLPEASPRVEAASPEPGDRDSSHDRPSPSPDAPPHAATPLPSGVHPEQPTERHEDPSALGEPAAVEPPPSFSPVAPDAAAPTAADEPGGGAETSFRVVVRVDPAEDIVLSEFSAEAAAEEAARAFVARLADTDEWPLVGRSFVRPDRVLAVAIAEHRLSAEPAVRSGADAGDGD